MKTKTIKDQRIKINLQSEQGNAFYLMGLARKLSKMLGMDTIAIHREMTKSDYVNLINTFEKHFGAYVILER
jgi:hypothetical protein